MRKIALLYFILILNIAAAQNVFDFGEENLKYNAKYGFIKGGEVKITSKKVKYENEDCYDVKIDMYAIGLVDDLFHFHDIFRSVFSTKSFKPYKFIRDAQEGKYTQHEEVTYYDNYVESTVKGRFATNERYYDLVSGIFALRAYDWTNLKEGSVLIFPIYFDESVFDTKVIYKGKEKIQLNGKYYNCRKFVPVFSGTTMFSKEGISAYFQDDYNRKLVLIKVNFKVGSFKVELVE